MLSRRGWRLDSTNSCPGGLDCISHQGERDTVWPYSGLVDLYVADVICLSRESCSCGNVM